MAATRFSVTSVGARALGGLACAWVLASCDSADLTDCGRGTYVVGNDGVEYCVYATDEVERDALGRPRCPSALPAPIELTMGLVCARTQVRVDELPAHVCRGLDDECGGSTSTTDAGPAMPDARPPDGGPVDAGRVRGGSCSIGGQRTVATAPAPSVASIVARTGSGYAVAWAGTLHLLGPDGAPERTFPIGADEGGGYGLAETEGTIVVSWVEGAAVQLGWFDSSARTGVTSMLEPAAEPGTRLLAAGPGEVWLTYVRAVLTHGRFVSAQYRMGESGLLEDATYFPDQIALGATPCSASLGRNRYVFAASLLGGVFATIDTGGGAVTSIDAWTSTEDIVVAWAEGQRAVVLRFDGSYSRDMPWTAISTAGMGLYVTEVASAPNPGTDQILVAASGQYTLLHRFDPDLVEVGEAALVWTDSPVGAPIDHVDLASSAAGAALVWSVNESVGIDKTLVFATVECD